MIDPRLGHLKVLDSQLPIPATCTADVAFAILQPFPFLPSFFPRNHLLRIPEVLESLPPFDVSLDEPGLFFDQARKYFAARKYKSILSQLVKLDLSESCGHPASEFLFIGTSCRYCEAYPAFHQDFDDLVKALADQGSTISDYSRPLPLWLHLEFELKDLETLCRLVLPPAVRKHLFMCPAPVKFPKAREVLPLLRDNDNWKAFTLLALREHRKGADYEDVKVRLKGLLHEVRPLVDSRDTFPYLKTFRPFNLSSLPAKHDLVQIFSWPTAKKRTATRRNLKMAIEKENEDYLKRTGLLLVGQKLPVGQPDFSLTPAFLHLRVRRIWLACCFDAILNSTLSCDCGRCRPSSEEWIPKGLAQFDSQLVRRFTFLVNDFRGKVDDRLLGWDEKSSKVFGSHEFL